MNFIIASSRAGYEHLAPRLEEKTGHKFFMLEGKNDLTVGRLKELKPEKIFFPHWSYIIPNEVFSTFDCVIFHMTDLPFGRGGSPLQNLISRGIYETKVSALKCITEIDAGPIYLKRDLSLFGTAEEIFNRIKPIIGEMMEFIVINNPSPCPQEGNPVNFKRRRPSESNIGDLQDLTKIYDFIRMLDADGYPKAFIETKKFRFEFTKAQICDEAVRAEVIIKPISKA